MSPEGRDAQPNKVMNRLRMLLLNPVSMVGSLIAIISLANIAFLFVIDLISDKPSPYIGILAYMVMPGFLILGLALIVTGFILQRKKKIEAGAEIPHYPVLDFNDPHQRSL